MASRSRTLIAIAVALATGALAVAPAALADTSVSSNWAGYAAHRQGLTFRSVSAAWRQPTLDCSTARPGYSAMWVGLGGYSASSNALEQIGTEIDCSPRGQTMSSAWYELVPAPSEPISMAVRPGDLMRAEVTLTGGRHVRMTLTDATRHRSYRRTFIAPAIDAGSAEWIIEAPSACTGNSACRTLPLADFGTAAFDLTTARTATSGPQPISSPLWDTTAIALIPGARHFIGYASPARQGGALPAALQSGGSAFSVAFSSGVSSPGASQTAPGGLPAVKGGAAADGAASNGGGYGRLRHLARR